MEKKRKEGRRREEEREQDSGDRHFYNRGGRGRRQRPSLYWMVRRLVFLVRIVGK